MFKVGDRVAYEYVRETHGAPPPKPFDVGTVVKVDIDNEASFGVNFPSLEDDQTGCWWYGPEELRLASAIDIEQVNEKPPYITTAAVRRMIACEFGYSETQIDDMIGRLREGWPD